MFGHNSRIGPILSGRKPLLLVSIALHAPQVGYLAEMFGRVRDLEGEKRAGCFLSIDAMIYHTSLLIRLAIVAIEA